MNEQYNILIESRLTKLETLIENHEKIFKEIRGEFNSIDARFIRLEDKIDRNFLWTTGLIIGSILLPYINAYLRSKGISI